MVSIGQKLVLKAKTGCVLNCLGMQPIFVDNGQIHESFVGFVYRLGNIVKPLGNQRQFHKYRLGVEENKEILDNAFHIKDADKVLVKTLLNDRTFTFKQNCSLDELMKIENHDKLKELILMHFLRTKYYTMMCQGNFIITSRQDLYNRRLFTSSEVLRFEVYLVDDSVLPRNVIILGHSPNTAFRSPYVACPLIDKNHFDELCKMNDIDINSFELDTKKRYPIIDKYYTMYSLYQSYLDNVDVPYWYIETFNNPVKTRQKAYYTTLFFD